METPETIDATAIFSRYLYRRGLTKPVPNALSLECRGLNRFWRLKIRYEHRADIHRAFLQLGSARISLRFPG